MVMFLADPLTQGTSQSEMYRALRLQVKGATITASLPHSSPATRRQDHLHREVQPHQQAETVGYSVVVSVVV
eukprot:m.45972 g.45972  ORF g.45972 m.45972 type:complete len:72 (+) comp10909_c0_seq1:36-251(+)